MIHYQICFYGRDGSPARRRDVSCIDDDDAIQELAWIRHPHALELRRDDEVIWRFDAAPEAMRAPSWLRW